MDKLKSIAVFVCIADHGSLTAASEVLGASLPTVVRTLAALEAELGVRLFNRSTRRIALTNEGLRYLGTCRHLLTSLDEAESALRGDSDELAGQLTITAPVLFGQMHVAPSLNRFVRQHQNVRCSLILADRQVNLLEEGMDLGVRIGRLNDSSLVAHQVGQVRRMVVAAPAYLSNRKTPVHPKDLLQANCIDFSGAGNSWWAFQINGRLSTLPATGNLEFNHVAPALAACLDGLGFGMFLSYQVAQHIEEGRLQTVLDDYELPPRAVSIIYPHARLLPARTRAFIEWIRADLASGSYFACNHSRRIQ